jgi:hypothetical protein
MIKKLDMVMPDQEEILVVRQREVRDVGVVQDLLLQDVLNQDLILLQDDHWAVLAQYRQGGLILLLLKKDQGLHRLSLIEDPTILLLLIKKGGWIKQYSHDL